MKRTRRNKSRNIPNMTWGGVDLEMSRQMLVACCELKNGQQMMLIGSSPTPEDESSSQEVSMKVTHHDEHFNFCIQACGVPPDVENLQQIWHCSFSGISISTKQTNSATPHDYSCRTLLDHSSETVQTNSNVATKDQSTMTEQNQQPGATTDNYYSCETNRQTDQSCRTIKPGKSNIDVTSLNDISDLTKKKYVQPSESTSSQASTSKQIYTVRPSRRKRPPLRYAGRATIKQKQSTGRGVKNDVNYSKMGEPETADHTTDSDSQSSVEICATKAWLRGKKLVQDLRKKVIRFPAANYNELYKLNTCVVWAMRSREGESQHDEDTATRVSPKKIRQECVLCGEIMTQARCLPGHITGQHNISVKQYISLLQCEAAERGDNIQTFNQIASLWREDTAGKLVCGFCVETHDGIVALIRHVKLCHSEETGLLSKLAMRQVSSDADDGDKDLIHTDKAETDIAQDVKSHSRNIKDQHPCRYCGQVLAFLCSRSRHENYYCLKNPSRRKKINCSKCTKVFYSREEMRQHKATHVPERSAYACEICGKARASKSGLYQHQLTAHNIKPARFSCKICDKSFHMKDKYLRHLSVHDDARPFICEVCGKTFKTRHSVTKHRRSVHHNSYRYHCEICGHGVEKASYLKSHKCGRVRRSQRKPQADPEEISVLTDDNLNDQDATQIEIQLAVPMEDDAEFETTEELFIPSQYSDKAFSQYILPNVPSLQTQTGISPLLQSQTGISPLLQSQTGISSFLQSQAGILPFLQSQASIPPLLQQQTGFSSILQSQVQTDIQNMPSMAPLQPVPTFPNLHQSNLTQTLPSGIAPYQRTNYVPLYFDDAQESDTPEVNNMMVELEADNDTTEHSALNINKLLNQVDQENQF